MSTNVKEVKWGDESVDLEIGAGITPEEQRVIEERMKELDLLLKAEKKPATYKLEVMFNDERSQHNPFSGVVTLWESGNKLHGGGDTKVYVCPGPERKGSTCKGILLDSSGGVDFIACV